MMLYVVSHLPCLFVTLRYQIFRLHLSGELCAYLHEL